MILTITNGTECYAQYSFVDINGNSYTPTSLSYSVWDLTNNVNVLPYTSVTPAQSGTITLTSAVNTMSALSVNIERRQVTLQVGIPGGTYRYDTQVYNIVSSAGAPAG